MPHLLNVTKKLFKKMIIRNAISGERSIPIPNCKGIIFRMWYKIGSVALYKNWTIGLYGSGFTQLNKALINISQYSMVKTIFTRLANAAMKLDKMNIYFI